MKTEETKDTITEEETAPEQTEEKTEAPADDWKDKYVRLYADFDNYKKRMQKEMTSELEAAAIKAAAIAVWVLTIWMMCLPMQKRWGSTAVIWL